jgi:hypothetical protein
MKQLKRNILIFIYAPLSHSLILHKNSFTKGVGMGSLSSQWIIKRKITRKSGGDSVDLFTLNVVFIRHLPVNPNHAGWVERSEIYQFQAP